VTLPSLTIDAVREGLLSRRFSARELAAEALRFAEAENPKTSAYLRFSPERALAAAECVDRRIARGEDPGPLGGVPLAVKDVIVTKGVVTTCGSRLLASYVPPYDATAVVTTVSLFVETLYRGAGLVAADVSNLLVVADGEMDIQPIGPSGPSLRVTGGFHRF